MSGFAEPRLEIGERVIEVLSRDDARGILVAKIATDSPIDLAKSTTVIRAYGRDGSPISDPMEKAWSDAAREAAAEARRGHAGTKPLKGGIAGHVADAHADALAEAHDGKKKRMDGSGHTHVTFPGHVKGGHVKQTLESHGFKQTRSSPPSPLLGSDKKSPAEANYRHPNGTNVAVREHPEGTLYAGKPTEATVTHGDSHGARPKADRTPSEKAWSDEARAAAAEARKKHASTFAGKLKESHPGASPNVSHETDFSQAHLSPGKKGGVKRKDLETHLRSMGYKPATEGGLYEGSMVHEGDRVRAWPGAHQGGAGVSFESLDRKHHWDKPSDEPPSAGASSPGGIRSSSERAYDEWTQRRQERDEIDRIRSATSRAGRSDEGP